MEKSSKKEVIEEQLADKAEHEKKKKALESSQNFQVAVVLIIIALLLIALAVIIIVKNAQNNFKYSNLDFKREYDSQVLFYNTKLLAIDDSGQEAGYISFSFRNDPRKLSYIPVETSKIYFIKNNVTYVSYETTNKTEEDSGIASAGLGLFLRKVNNIDTKSSFNDPSFKNNTSFPYVNCETNPKNTVIMFINSDETKIIQDSQNPNCYKIMFKDSEMLKAAERFELAILEQIKATE